MLHMAASKTVFAPMDLMMKRVRRYSNSDSELFTELLYAGELIVKITVAAFVASIEDDREHHRYRLLHALVRADGIGAWASALDEALSGPASQHLAAALINERRIFSERVRRDAWQSQVVHELQDVLMGIHRESQPLGDRVSLRSWFAKFVELRNKTRGHGATTPATCSKLAPKLQRSIDLLLAHNPIFLRSWAYLHRNLSGKYKVVELGGDASTFENLKTASAVRGENYPDGVYMWAGRARRVDLIQSDLDASNFFLPNGGFDGKVYELHSLITDDRLAGDAAPYLPVAGNRAPSETEGKGELDLVGKVFTNLPSVPIGYVHRRQLEIEIKDALINDRHPIVTLVGRGGIGKTSLALSVLRDIANTDRYDVIVWFSSRDIDLTMSGTKAVQPKVLADRDIAEEYNLLIKDYIGDVNDDDKPLEIMQDHMRCSPLGRTLFVFDNFETVRSPVDLFQWIDTNVRLPNKAVITSRFREFKADLPIEVSGMENYEASELVRQTAISLNIDGMISVAQCEQIIEESNGHPYVIKIILGDIANTGKFGKPSKLMARKDDILDALFDRTYANLAPMATRIFLTLAGW